MLAHPDARVAVLERDPAEAELGLVSVVADVTDDEAVELAADSLIPPPENQP